MILSTTGLLLFTIHLQFFSKNLISLSLIITLIGLGASCMPAILEVKNFYKLIKK